MDRQEQEHLQEEMKVMPRKRDLSTCYTIEGLSQRYEGNLFELVNHAIVQAEHWIKSGREVEDCGGVKNRAFQILDRLSKGEDTYYQNLERIESWDDDEDGSA